MKISFSFLLPYHNRANLLEKSLESFLQYSSDFEILLGVDEKTWSNNKLNNQLLQVVNKYPDFDIKIINIKGWPNTYNPSACFNILAKEAKYDFFIISNPEIIHGSDLITGLTEIYEQHPMFNPYIICACKNVDSEDRFLEWYQHSEYKNNQLHFCSCIYKDSYYFVGGFDEEYMAGIGYEDNDFIDKIKYSGIPIITADHLIVSHQNHPNLKRESPNRGKLLGINQKIYEKRCRGRK